MYAQHDGFISLAGIVVNDSILLMEFIKIKVEKVMTSLMPQFLQQSTLPSSHAHFDNYYSWPAAAACGKKHAGANAYPSGDKYRIWSGCLNSNGAFCGTFPVYDISGLAW